MNNNRDSWTVDAMETYGGSFVFQLAHLARRADASNLAKIKQTWPDYWMQYENMGIQMESQREIPASLCGPSTFKKKEYADYQFFLAFTFTCLTLISVILFVLKINGKI